MNIVSECIGTWIQGWAYSITMEDILNHFNNREDMDPRIEKILSVMTEEEKSRLIDQAMEGVEEDIRKCC